MIASVAQSKGKIAETRIQILQIDQDMRTEVGKDLADIRGKTAELVEKRVAAEDQLKRVDIRAPQDGMVHQLDVHTVGGVVSAGQQIMLIVPGADKLIVEAKVQPQDIDQVRIGQTAVMRFSNFNTRLIGSIGVFAINPALFKDLRYDPQKDFDLLSVAVHTPNVLVANPGDPANSVRELIEQLNKKPGKVTFASSGTASSDHLTAALFWQKTGTTGIHVPYRGGGPAINDLIAGHANVSFQNLGAITKQVKSGKLKALAVTSDKRIAALPNVPTMAEAGVKDLEVYSWQAAAAPKDCPRVHGETRTLVSSRRSIA